ncbi:hypothetical protein MHU86_18483 [Fragilaria crotonensis]|nr:hypothetical protein MHU86_18483 [Fragilaria crotonensis]
MQHESALNNYMCLTSEERMERLTSFKNFNMTLHPRYLRSREPNPVPEGKGDNHDKAGRDLKGAPKSPGPPKSPKGPSDRDLKGAQKSPGPPKSPKGPSGRDLKGEPKSPGPPQSPKGPVRRVLKGAPKPKSKGAPN